MESVKGFIETSFVDWAGRTCAVLFLAGCNFRCSFCHNHPLVLNFQELVFFPLDEIIARLEPLKKWLGGVCVSGGEPTLDKDLPLILERLQREGYKLKIDTNGSRPDVLAELIEKGMLDMISMDVKAPLVQEKYDRCCGVRVDLANIRKSIKLIRESGLQYEFRMTVLPRYHSREDITEWVSCLGSGAVLKLQNFNPRETMYPGLAGERGFTPEEFEELTTIVRNVA